MRKRLVVVGGTGRPGWEALPDAVLDAVRERTGQVRAVRMKPGRGDGWFRAALDAERGRVFVKGARVEHESAWLLEREAGVGPLLGALGPEVRWRVTAEGWDLVGWEHVEGRAADYAPGSPDLPRVVEALTGAGRLACAGAEVAVAGLRWGAYLDDRADAALLDGEALLHTGWHPGQVLIGEDGPRLVGWGMATRGAAWIDPACWVLRLVLAGHGPAAAERWAARVPAWAKAPRRALDAFAAAQARYWWAAALERPETRARGLADAAAAWAAHRRGEPGAAAEGQPAAWAARGGSHAPERARPRPAPIRRLRRG
ncbi:aminoglycoside phosphotransferase [Streptomyces hoynatensis]|uniref:Aminoglycoside phosphotransferase n=1 Tax=Streptomyces hoynatensis TaxID=1141874 RepID=A0A3A9YRW5_9ACTN|nr:aminoglycoside phosphotransferase [Streptomyces hoynatensis]RKN37986.1 aminoglycoside phosphotransferase [Streptomyces hoynatensis]